MKTTFGNKINSIKIKFDKELEKNIKLKRVLYKSKSSQSIFKYNDKLDEKMKTNSQLIMKNHSNSNLINLKSLYPSLKIRNKKNLIDYQIKTSTTYKNIFSKSILNMEDREIHDYFRFNKDMDEYEIEKSKNEIKYISNINNRVNLLLNVNSHVIKSENSISDGNLSLIQNISSIKKNKISKFVVNQNGSKHKDSVYIDMKLRSKSLFKITKPLYNLNLNKNYSIISDDEKKNKEILKIKNNNLNENDKEYKFLKSNYKMKSGKIFKIPNYDRNSVVIKNDNIFNNNESDIKEITSTKETFYDSKVKQYSFIKKNTNINITDNLLSKSAIKKYCELSNMKESESNKDKQRIKKTFINLYAKSSNNLKSFSNIFKNKLLSKEKEKIYNRLNSNLSISSIKIHNRKIKNHNLETIKTENNTLATNRSKNKEKQLKPCDSNSKIKNKKYSIMVFKNKKQINSQVFLKKEEKNERSKEKDCILKEKEDLLNKIHNCYLKGNFGIMCELYDNYARKYLLIENISKKLENKTSLKDLISSIKDYKEIIKKHNSQGIISYNEYLLNRIILRNIDKLDKKIFDLDNILFDKINKIH